MLHSATMRGPMTDNQKEKEQDASRTILCAVLEEGRIGLVRVLGRGSFSNSLPLKRFSDHFISLRQEGQKFVLDLHECETMDSTFMGVVAGICISLVQQDGGRVVAVNVNDHCQRLLKNLGLTHLLEIRSGGSKDLARGEKKLAPPEENGESDKLRQICLTLEAHKDLIKVDEQNEVRFQAVIEYLEKSLQEEGGRCPSD